MPPFLRRPRVLLPLLAVLALLAGLFVRWAYFVYPLNNDLLYAAREGDLPQMETLFRKGADPNARGEQWWTPLTAAAERGQLPAVAWLLDHGAAVNQLEGGGNSALFYAAFQGHGDVADLLLRQGADPNLKGGGRQNLSPLMIAEQQGHLELAARLRAGGAK